MNLPIVIERNFNATADIIWKAITDKEQMKQWYFDLAAFRPEAGFEFRFYGEGHKGDKYLHLCKVLEAVPGKKLVYSWSYENLKGYSVVAF